MPNKKKETILVTGGSGFLGFSLVDKLVQTKNNIIVFDNDFRGNFKKFSKKIKNLKLIKGDIRNTNKLKLAFNKCDRVFHLAFINGTSNFYDYPKLVMDVGINGTINLLNLCLKSKKLNNFHYASSSEVYHKPKKYPASENEFLTIPDPSNSRFSYSGSKIIGELLTFNYLKKTNIKHNIFRPHNVFGPQMGFEHVIPQIIEKIYKSSNKFKLKKCVIKIQGSGEETRSFCFVNDAIDQILQISNKGKDKNIYNIGQEKEISINKLIQDISKILKIKVIVKTGKLTLGSVKRRCPDMSKTFKLKPLKNNYLNGLRTTVEWYKNYFIHEKKR